MCQQVFETFSQLLNHQYKPLLSVLTLTTCNHTVIVLKRLYGHSSVPK